MRVLISGASGLLGGALTERLRADGDEASALVRREPRGPGESRWDPAAGSIDPAALDGVDAVVNFSGAPIAGFRATSSRKQQIRSSRVDSSSTLARALAARPADERPAVFVSGSAIGYYGDTGNQPVDESAGPGDGFLPDVVVDWERCTQPAADAGIRTVTIRTGVVLTKRGGALGLALPLFRLGLGGRLGSGRQWMSWISLTDHIAAVRWLLDHDTLSGPVNLTAPAPVTNAEYTSAIGRVLHRPTVLPAPAVGLRLLLGDLADESVLVSQRVLPRRLLDSGFRFTHPDVDSGLRAEV